MSRPTIRPGMLTRQMGDGLIVFDPARHRAHALDPTAAAVWRAVAEGAAAETLPRGLDLPADQVDAALARLADVHLVDLGASPGLSRRTALKGVLATSGALMVSTVVLPAARAAASTDRGSLSLTTPPPGAIDSSTTPASTTTTTDYDLIGSAAVSDNRAAGSEFTIATTGALTGVAIYFGRSSSVATTVGAVQIAVQAITGNVPGAVLTSALFNGTEFPPYSVSAPVFVTFPQSLNVAAGDAYYLTLSSPDDGSSYKWALSATNGTSSLSEDGGTTWTPNVHGAISAFAIYVQP